MSSRSTSSSVDSGIGISSGGKQGEMFGAGFPDPDESTKVMRCLFALLTELPLSAISILSAVSAFPVTFPVRLPTK